MPRILFTYSSSHASVKPCTDIYCLLYSISSISAIQWPAASKQHDCSSSPSWPPRRIICTSIPSLSNSTWRRKTTVRVRAPCLSSECNFSMVWTHSPCVLSQISDRGRKINPKSLSLPGINLPQWRMDYTTSNSNNSQRASFPAQRV